MTKAKHRIFVNQSLEAESSVALGDHQAHYLSRVLRVRAGDQVIVFDGKGASGLATVTSLSKSGGGLHLDGVLEHEPEPSLAITLVQAVAKGEKMDWIVQKATELGASIIYPVITERTVVRLNSDKASRRLQRWQSVVINACEQSNRNHLPVVHEPIPLGDALQKCSADKKLVLTLDSNKTLPQFSAPKASVSLVIGPEGGLEEKEIQAAVDIGFQRASLGPRTLRTETAAVSSLALVQGLWGDLAFAEGKGEIPS